MRNYSLTKEKNHGKMALHSLYEQIIQNYLWNDIGN